MRRGLNPRRSVLVATLYLALSACDEPLGPTVPIDEEFVLAPGDSATVEDLEVRFLRVLNDSRCPADANCVWQGDATVQIAATIDRRTRELELHTSETKPVTYEGYSIHLVQLQPYPFSSRTIQPDDYRVTVKVTR